MDFTGPAAPAGARRQGLCRHCLPPDRCSYLLLSPTEGHFTPRMALAVAGLPTTGFSAQGSLEAQGLRPCRFAIACGGRQLQAGHATAPPRHGRKSAARGFRRAAASPEPRPRPRASSARTPAARRPVTAQPGSRKSRRAPIASRSVLRRHHLRRAQRTRRSAWRLALGHASRRVRLVVRRGACVPVGLALQARRGSACQRPPRRSRVDGRRFRVPILAIDASTNMT